MASIFTKIINREIPGHFIFEDQLCVAILDKFPAIPGQTLIIPKAEIDYIVDLDEETYVHICSIAKKVARALDAVFMAKRTCFVVEGFEVPHVHIKLYPMHETTLPLGSLLPNGTLASDDTLADHASRIKAFLTSEQSQAS
jgi:histidine triad (HIT) family protein